MSKRVHENKFFLQYFGVCKPSHRKLLLDIADRSQFMTLLEVVKNCMCGVVPLHKKCKAQLLKKRSIFRTLCFDRKKSWKKKRDLIKRTQSGGILGTLAAAAGSYLFEKGLSHIADKLFGDSSSNHPEIDEEKKQEQKEAEEYREARTTGPQAEVGV